MNLLIKSLVQNADDIARLCSNTKHLVTKNGLSSKPILELASGAVGDIVQITSKKHSTRKIAGITKEALESYLVQGKSAAEIAKSYDCTPSTINRYVRTMLGVSTKKVVNLTDDTLRMQVAEGLSLPQLAELNGCSITTIQARLKTLGLKTLEAERVDSISKEYLEILVNEGWDCKKIAEKFKVSDLQIGKLLKKFNLETEGGKFERMVRKQDIIDLYDAGAKSDQLAEIFGVPQYIIDRTLSRFGLVGYKAPVKEIVEEQVKITPNLLNKMLGSGKTKAQIAEELGVTPETLVSKINDFGLSRDFAPPKVEEVLSDIGALKQMLKKGKTVEDIAYSYDFDVDTVKNYLHSVGITDYLTNSKIISKIQSLASLGLSSSEISKNLQIPVKDVDYYIESCRFADSFKKRFLDAYKESMIARFSGKDEVLNLRSYFGISDKEYDRLTYRYGYELEQIFKEVSSKFRK